jgi:hypothetical protein
VAGAGPAVAGRFVRGRATAQAVIGTFSWEFSGDTTCGELMSAISNGLT